jgi:hypothetical protein
MFATGQMNNGVKLANVQIRIGGPRETDVAGCPLGNLKCMRRALGAYMSQRDLQQMGARLETRAFFVRVDAQQTLSFTPVARGRSQ